jgi:predicted flap endonuclease-1-like 5' DNA nuclease
MLLLNMLLHIPMNCWLPLLLACILPFILGWLFGSLLRGKGASATGGSTAAYGGGLQAQLDEAVHRASDYEKTNVDLKYKLEECQKESQTFHDKLMHADADVAGLRAKIAVMQAQALQAVAPEASSISAAVAAPASEMSAELEPASGIAYGTIFAADNLQIVEGIGPKVNELLAKNGIVTWADLASKKPEDIRPILESAGSAYKMMDPGTWPKQAELAASGNWDGLVAFQKALDTGKTNATGLTPAKVEEMALKILGFSNNPEDLKIVEGIGPKIEELLKNAGIMTWAELAAAPVDRLQEILSQAGDAFRLAKPDTWPKQAELASKGQWGELKTYQEFLSGGKDPS